MISYAEMFDQIALAERSVWGVLVR